MSQRFIRDVDRYFSKFFKARGFYKRGQEADFVLGSVVAANTTHYLRITCDIRDGYINVSIGHLAEGLIPPVPIAPSKSTSDVREIPLSILVWLETGDKDLAFSLGTYRTLEDLDSSVRKLADSLEMYGDKLLSEDPSEWQRAAQLLVSRRLNQGSI